MMSRREHGNWSSSLDLDFSGANRPWRSLEILKNARLKGLENFDGYYQSALLEFLTVGGKKYPFLTADG